MNMVRRSVVGRFEEWWRAAGTRQGEHQEAASQTVRTVQSMIFNIRFALTREKGDWFPRPEC